MGPRRGRPLGYRSPPRSTQSDLSRLVENDGQQSATINSVLIGQLNNRSVLIRVVRLVTMLRHLCQRARFCFHRFGVERFTAKQKNKTDQPQRHESGESFMRYFFQPVKRHETSRIITQLLDLAAITINKILCRPERSLVYLALAFDQLKGISEFTVHRFGAVTPNVETAAF